MFQFFYFNAMKFRNFVNSRQLPPFNDVLGPKLIKESPEFQLNLHFCLTCCRFELCKMRRSGEIVALRYFIISFYFFPVNLLRGLAKFIGRLSQIYFHGLL